MARHDIEALSCVIGGFYDAAYGAAPWSDALVKVTELMHCSRSWLFNSRPGYLNAQTSVHDEGFESREGQAAAMRDPLFELYRSRKSGTVVRHSDIEDVSAFRNRELWQDWLRVRDMDFGLQCTLSRSGDDVFYLDLNRSMKQGDFTDDDLAVTAAILPHVIRAGAIGTMLPEQPGTPTVSAAPVAMLAVDASCRLIDANEAAMSVLDGRAAILGLSVGRLVPADPDTARRLHDLVAGCASRTPLPGGLILLNDPAGAPQMVVSVAPLAPRTRFGFSGEPLAAVFLRDVHGRAETALDDIVASLFQLPPAHARLAGVLATGIPLRQAAIERGISYATARTYLDHIFRQTGTSRQPELVALLKTLEAGLTV